MAGLLNLGKKPYKFYLIRFRETKTNHKLLIMQLSGWIMDFISGPVISGFCSAAAVTVITAQFKTLLGLKFPGSSFAKVFPGIFVNFMSISLWDTVLGFSFIIFLLLLKVIPFYFSFPIWHEYEAGNLRFDLFVLMFSIIESDSFEENLHQLELPSQSSRQQGHMVRFDLS
jgi:MFS superfamily sulfate permease-like transporter